MVFEFGFLILEEVLGGPGTKRIFATSRSRPIFNETNRPMARPKHAARPKIKKWRRESAIYMSGLGRALKRHL